MTAEISACAPPGINNFFGLEGFSSCDLTRNLVAIKNCLAKYPEYAARRDEGAGDALAALDYGIMSYIKGDRGLSRMYLVKAILSSSSTDACKAEAHGVLIS